MTGERRVRAGPVTIALSGVDPALPTVGVFAGLPAADPDASVDLRIDFEPDLRVPGRAARAMGRHPLYAAPGGLVVVDHAGREAYLPLAELPTRPVRIDPALDLHVLQTWVQLPLLRMALHRAGGGLVRCTVVEVEGRRTALVAPARTGKTRLVLALLRDGARLVGDDWIAVDASGRCSPACRLLVVRDEARDDTGHRSARGLLVRVLRRAAASSMRWRRLSLALAYAADVTWRLGQQIRDVAGVVPDARIAPDPAALDEVVLLSATAAELATPDVEDIAEAVVAAAVVEHPEQYVLDGVFRLAHPGILAVGAMPTQADDRELARALFRGARAVLMPFDGTTPTVRRCTELLGGRHSAGPDDQGEQL
ncbi:MAG TPA: hypothetical protein VK906_06990 [Egicoccus sp.]|nr:hypothetical protein [Egicoccus sp.]HSK22901.1 hypothetical protein [Egicoccus sp.]